MFDKNTISSFVIVICTDAHRPATILGRNGKVAVHEPLGAGSEMFQARL